MQKLTAYSSYEDAQKHYSGDALWALFDGDKSGLNIATECIDRHADTGQIAVNIVRAGEPVEALSFRHISEASSQFAHWLVARGIKPGDRIAVMLEPSLAFYAALFGAMKMGAVAVPLFTLFGPDGIRLRVEDCRPRLFLTNPEKAPAASGIDGVDVIIADGDMMAALAEFPTTYDVRTGANDLAALQYTSGTTRLLPEAVKHTHRSIVTLMNAALYGSGLRPGDQFFCPSSPAWGHGLWHGTLAPLALGITTGTFSGRFDAETLLQAMEALKITNLAAAATHYRMIKNSGAAGNYKYAIQKLSFTGEPIDSDTATFVEQTFGVPLCSMYGTTEIGVIISNYPGAGDYDVRPGSLGKPVPGVKVEVHGPDGQERAVNEIGELVVWRRGAWFPTKDLGKVDGDGYFFHAGRADDVIISAGWTMSAVEIEDAILKHDDVLETAAIGVPDELRGQIVKAFVVSARPGDDAFGDEIKTLVRERLSLHEYPREVAFVPSLPKTPAGKINRKTLRDQARGAS